MSDLKRKALVGFVNQQGPQPDKKLINAGLPMGYYTGTRNIMDDVDEGDESRRKRKRISEEKLLQRQVNSEYLKQNTTMLQTDPLVRKALAHLKAIVFEGGFDVTICKFLPYPGYTNRVEHDLMEQMMRAFDWYMIGGFIPFRCTPYTPYDQWLDYLKRNHDGWHSSDDDSFEIPPCSMHLTGSDLLFQIPSLGLGEYTAYYDPGSNSTRIDFIKTWGKSDDDEPWYVYVVEEPTLDGKPTSPLSALLPEYQTYRKMIKADEDATALATHPILVMQERPPQRTDHNILTAQSLLNGAPSIGSGLGGAPKGVPYGWNGTPQQQQQQRSGTEKPSSMSALLSSVENSEALTNLVKERQFLATYYGSSMVNIDDGKTFAGVVTPHAYTSMQERERQYTRAVSMALDVPLHMIESTSSVTSKSSLANQANKNKTKPSPQGETAPRSTPTQQRSYTGDPIYITATRIRHMVKNFFAAVVEITHQYPVIDEYFNTMRRQSENGIEERQQRLIMYDTVIHDYETRIKAAEISIREFDPTDASPTSAESATEAAVVENKNVPSVDEIKEFTRRRLELQNDTQQLRDAVQELNQIKSTDKAVEVQFRLPFLLDTADPAAVIETIGGTPEFGQAIARARLGLGDKS